MSRYVKDFAPIAQPDPLFKAVHTYLSSEGYEYREYKGENVFKKGKGLMMGPTFIKLSFSPSATRVEAWMKYALLPGVYVGEIGLKGMTGGAVKGLLKQRVARIEAMIAQCISSEAASPNGGGFCPDCGKPLQTGSAFCSACGKQI